MGLLSLTGDKNSILQLREEHGVAHQRSFPGCQLIDWLLQNGEAESRRQGLELCRALQEHGIIQHGERSPRSPFKAHWPSAAASVGNPGSLKTTIRDKSYLLLFCAALPLSFFPPSGKEASLLWQWTTLSVLYQFSPPSPPFWAPGQQWPWKWWGGDNISTRGKPTRQSTLCSAQKPNPWEKQRFPVW